MDRQPFRSRGRGCRDGEQIEQRWWRMAMAGGTQTMRRGVADRGPALTVTVGGCLRAGRTTVADRAAASRRASAVRPAPPWLGSAGARRCRLGFLPVPQGGAGFRRGEGPTARSGRPRRRAGAGQQDRQGKVDGNDDTRGPVGPQSGSAGPVGEEERGPRSGEGAGRAPRTRTPPSCGDSWAGRRRVNWPPGPDRSESQAWASNDERVGSHA